MLHRPLADGSGSSEFLGGRTSIGLTLNGRRYAKLIVAPTADYSGAWIAHVDRDRYTTLSLFTPEEGLEVQWEDAAGPDIEALHAGRSGNTLLVQVHRERPLADQRVFVDPALAIWTRGEGAPQGYDELYMNEQNTKGFVHLDVDRAAAGAPFVFDAGLVVMVPTYYPGMPPPTFPMPPTAPNPPPTAGGGDVVQEWGVARASLKQRLVLPAIGRTPGANGSNWRSDVILSNPVDAPQRVTLRVAANGAGGGAAVLPVATITLAPQEIRLIPDALQTLFDRESGSGALFLDPEFAINASSRTYTTSARGTYGFNMNAVDTSTGFGPRFPASFAAAISGTTSRSNLVLTDVSESGIDVELRSRRPQADDAHLTLTSPAIRQLQLDHLARQFDLGSSGEAALDVTSRNGFVIPSLIAVDNGTNDPTYFPADSSTARMRMIPALGSVMGPNGARYVSDLHFYNASDQPAGMTIQAKRWDSSESKTFSVALAPNETLVWRDVVRTKFNQSGIVRARMQASGNVRVTSRTYTVDPVTGGTYGFALPPLNNFQIAAPGDTLEILGAVIDPRFRTNLALVDTAVVNRVDLLPVHVEIVASGGEVLRAFDTNVQTAGGTQLVDLFRGIDVPSPAAVLIRVSPRAGLVAAFATIIDNQTNDPGYLAANLGAKTN
jgi:hypothetical protein